MGFIRTISGDIPTDQLKIIFSHEHIVIEEGWVTRQYPAFLLNDEARIMEELAGLKTLGLDLVVDTMPCNAGRNVEKSARISAATGVHIVIPTGIHLEMYYPETHWRYQYGEDQLTTLFMADVEIGIDRHDYNGPVIERTSCKAGMIKLATADEPFTPHQEMIFRAVVNTHLKTGVPILTHTNSGRHALAQAELFTRLGADPQHIVISHVDRLDDPGYHRALLDTGVSVEYDSAFRWKPGEKNITYALLETLLPDYPDQITVGMDAARNAYWRSFGGKPGLDYLLTTFVDEMKNRGLGVYLDKIFCQNPGRIFSFRT